MAEKKETASARERLEALFDGDTFVETDRLLTAAGVVTGFGYVDGTPVYAFSQDREVIGGAVGCEQALKISRIYELAGQNGAPLVGIFDSDGARLAEGTDAMDAIALILRRSQDLSGVVPQIAVVAGACVGSAALIAASADLVIAAEDADYYLTPGGERAEADMTVCCDKKAVAVARQLLSYLPQNNLAAPALFEGADPADASEPAAMAADEGSLLRLSDRLAFGRVDGAPVGFVTLKDDRIGNAGPAARFVRLCDSFSLPVITFVDAAGFETLADGARLSQAYAETTSPRITVITGRAYGAVYIALAGKSAGADAVLAWPGAVISPLAPETAVELLWQDKLKAMADPVKDRPALAAEYAAAECSPEAAAAKGILTDLTEPAATRGTLIGCLNMLAGKRVTHLPRKHANIRL